MELLSMIHEWILAGWSMFLSVNTHMVGINLILAVIIVFFERRDPRTLWTWLLLLYFMPGVGFILYLIIGQNMRKKKMFQSKEVEDAIYAAIHKQEERVRNEKIFLKNGEMSQYSDLVLYNLEAAKSVYTDDNEIEIFTDGKEYFSRLYEEIRQAKKFIHIQSYIIKNDELWQPLEQLLFQKVAEGVQVRILYDSMGCRTMRRSDWERMRQGGIEIGEFFPALFKRLHMRVNYRNHRKIVVIDGKKAMLGGFNIGREYLGLDEYFGYWRDTHLMLQGSAVLSVHIRFIMDWNYATKDDLFKYDHLFIGSGISGVGNEGVQIISSGPDSENLAIRDNYLKIINNARDHLYIQSPYLIPDESVFNAIKMAAQSGVDVKIMIPCKPDHPFVYWASYSYAGDLIKAGAECYTYDKGFIHAKGITADGVVSCFGTANMDIRSFQLNFEVNATIYSKKTAKRMEEIFEKDLEDCTRITSYLYSKRGIVIRFKEQFSRMLSLIL